MDANELLGRRIKIFGSDIQMAEHTAIIRSVDAESSSLLIEMEHLEKSLSAVMRFAVARPRREGAALEDLLGGRSIGCNVTYIPDYRESANNPFDLSWWRGGAATIADIALLREVHDV